MKDRTAEIALDLELSMDEQTAQIEYSEEENFRRWKIWNEAALEVELEFYARFLAAAGRFQVP